MLKWILTLGMVGSFAFAAESAKEGMNDAKESAQKGMHRAEEKMCAEGDAKCLAKKGKHRAQEMKTKAKDKVDENTPSK